MTSPAVAIDLRPLLAELLDEQFSDASLQVLLGPDEPVPWELWETSLYGPLADFVARPGKELRARLVDAGWSIAGGRGSAPVELVGIVEALHAGSLIVDDIEDGSAYRRGAPVLHGVWGLPRALNAGCWMYFWPDALLDRMRLAPALELALRRRIGSTLMACHAGQALDLGVRVFDLDAADVPRVVRASARLKTGSLTELAATLGAIAAGARSELSSAIASFGRELGVGLQMLDDLGGLTSEKRCHKGHEDLVLARATWPWAWLATEPGAPGFDELSRLSREVHARATHPEQLAEALRERLGPEPQLRPRRHLEQAHARLESTCGKTPASAALARALEEMESAYV